MSFEHSKLKRIDILNHLENNRNNIRPPDDRYKDEYVNFVCEQLGIEQSEVHYEVLIDISKIKSFYKACGYDFQKMKNKHKKFFNAYVKSKRLATAPPSPPNNETVCFNFKKIVLFLIKNLHFYISKLVTYISKHR